MLIEIPASCAGMKSRRDGWSQEANPSKEGDRPSTVELGEVQEGATLRQGGYAVTST